MSYKLYNKDYIDDSRSDTQLNTQDIGVLLYDDIYKGAFVIVNTSTTSKQYIINASGSNSAISGNLTVSTNDDSNNNYSGSINFYLDSYDRETIYYKYAVENAPILGSGTVYVAVKEI